MKVRTIALTLAVCLAGVALCYASDPNMGTWNLNEAKSKFPPGATKSTTVVYSAGGDMVKVTTDGTAGGGKPAHTEWTGKFDSKEYPVTGGPAGGTRSYTKVDAHTTTVTNKTDGKVTVSGRIVVAPDGKSRTVTLNWTSDDGKSMTSTGVYDKQ